MAPLHFSPELREVRFVPDYFDAQVAVRAVFSIQAAVAAGDALVEGAPLATVIYNDGLEEAVVVPAALHGKVVQLVNPFPDHLSLPKHPSIWFLVTTTS